MYDANDTKTANDIKHYALTSANVEIPPGLVLSKGNLAKQKKSNYITKFNRITEKRYTNKDQTKKSSLTLLT